MIRIIFVITTVYLLMACQSGSSSDADNLEQSLPSTDTEKPEDSDQSDTTEAIDELPTSSLLMPTITNIDPINLLDSFDGSNLSITVKNMGFRKQAAANLFDLGSSAWINGKANAISLVDQNYACGDYRDDYLQGDELFMPTNGSLYAKSSQCSFSGHPPIISQEKAARFNGNLASDTVYRFVGHKSYIGWPHAMSVSEADGVNTKPNQKSLQVNWMYRSNLDQRQYYRFDLNGEDGSQYKMASNDYWTWGEAVSITEGELSVKGFVLGFNKVYGHLHLVIPELDRALGLKGNGQIIGQQTGQRHSYTKIGKPGSNKYIRIWDKPSNEVFRVSLTGTEGLYGGGSDSDASMKHLLSHGDQQWHNIMVIADIDKQTMKAFVDGSEYYHVATTSLASDPDASPSIALLGSDNNASSADGYEFLRVEVSEIYLSSEKQAVFIADHGELSEVNNLCVQKIDDWDNDTGVISFKYRSCGIADENAYIYMVNDNMTFNNKGYHVKTGKPYTTKARHYLRLDGFDEYLRFPTGTIFTFPPIGWYFAAKIKPQIENQEALVLLASSVAEVLVINADNTVTLNKKRSLETLSDEIRSGQWLSLYLLSDETGTHLLVDYESGNSDKITIWPDALGDFKVDRIGRSPDRSVINLAGIADIDFNGQHYFSLNQANMWDRNHVKDAIGKLELSISKTEVNDIKYGPLPF